MRGGEQEATKRQVKKYEQRGQHTSLLTAGHDEQEVAPAPDAFPSGQLGQVVAPFASLLYRPGVQSSQSSGPSCFKTMFPYSFFLPFGQASHDKCLDASAAGSALYLPAPQTAHET